MRKSHVLDGKKTWSIEVLEKQCKRENKKGSVKEMKREREEQWQR